MGMSKREEAALGREEGDGGRFQWNKEQWGEKEREN